MFDGIEITEPDGALNVSGLSLSSAHFVNCWFHSAAFVNVDLSGATFSNCNLKCAAFERCNLDNTRWECCAVCSLAVRNCSAANVVAADLDAYGHPIDGGPSFLQYALDNGAKKGGC